jgi:hypothetical protein
MPLDWLQHERGFASFSPAPNRSLANADTCAGRKPQESRRSPRSSRATRYNAEWLVEKNGFRSPLDARAARLDTNLSRAA